MDNVQMNNQELEYFKNLIKQSEVYILKGDIYSEELHVTDKKSIVHGLLSPIYPSAIINVGLNYKKHIKVL